MAIKISKFAIPDFPFPILSALSLGLESRSHFCEIIRVKTKRVTRYDVIYGDGKQWCLLEK